MIFGAVLAGGIGSRMKFSDKPKQFLPLGNRPIILHSIQKFIDNKRFDIIYVGINPDWKSYLVNLLNEYSINQEKIRIIVGGHDRNSTIMNIISDIHENISNNKNDVIVTHDAVRPFVTDKIIEDNINSVLKHGMCGTAIPTIDTIIKSINGEYISDFYDRSVMFNEQTPQSFNIAMLKELYTALSEQEKKILTDACRIFTINGKDVKIVDGDPCNIKITTDSDYNIAIALYNISLGA